MNRSMPQPPESNASGVNFMTERLRELSTHRAQDLPCRAVFDLDNTLFDTRARTLAVAQEFDSQQGTTYFRHLSLDKVGLDAPGTCERLGGVPPDVSCAFEEFWRRAFWDPTFFNHDIPMDRVLAWVHKAHQAGAEVRFLTGRVEFFREVSLQQLRKAGVSFAQSESIHLKPDVSIWTIESKTTVLQRLLEEGYVAWYITEGRIELTSLQARIPGLPGVLLACSLEPTEPALLEGTPVLEGVF